MLRVNVGSFLLTVPDKRIQRKLRCQIIRLCTNHLQKIIRRFTERPMVSVGGSHIDYRQTYEEQLGAEDQLTPLTVEMLKKDGLGKLFHVLVAENQKGETKQLIGYLFFHYIYSTWQAKAILLTDVYVSPEFSEKSVAKELFILLCKIADEEGCARLQWEVKENDREKIDFVSISSAQNLSAEEGWHKYRFSKEQLLTF